MEKTRNGIEYDWGVCSPSGAHFELFPVRGVHTKGQVREAKTQLKNEQDVLHIQVTWRDNAHTEE